LWDEAITSFNQALNLKKDDEEAKLKLKEAEEGKKTAESGLKSNELYLAAIKKGDEAMLNKNFSLAITSYTEALTIKKDDSAAKKKLQEANAALNKESLSKENLEKYNQAMKNGNDAFSIKKWSESITYFTEALKYKKDDSEAKNKIKEAQDAISANEKGLKSEEQFAAAMKNGKEALANKKFDEAIDEFSKALKYKSEDLEAKNKLAEAEAGRDAEEKFKENMKLGRLYFKEKKWSQAIAVFNEILSLKSDETEAKEKLKEAEDNLKKELDKGKIEELYNSAMKFGNDAMNGKKFNDAIAAYTSALGYKKEDKEAKMKLDEARAGLKLTEQNKNLESKYLEAINKGRNHLIVSKWDSAILAFKSALEIKKNDSEASKLLAEAQEGLEKDKNSKENNSKYDKLMREGKNELSTSNWVQAVMSFKAALVLKPDDPQALKYLNDAEEKIKEQDLQKNFDKLIAKGDSSVLSKNYDLALERYNNAKALNINPTLVLEKIEKLKKLIEANKLAKSKEAEYHAAMKEGEDAEAAANWTTALQIYETKALIIRPSDKDALLRVEECKKAIKNKAFADSVSNREKNILEKYNLVIAEARTLFKNKDYKTSLKKYEEAQNIRVDESEPANKINEIKLLLSKSEEEELKLKNQLQIDKDFNDAIEQAKKLSSEKKYAAAKEKYRSAQLIKPTHLVPPAEIKKLEELIKNQEKTNTNINQIKYNSAISAGDNKFSSKNYQEAISFYREALKFKPNDSIASKKILDTESLIKSNSSDVTSTEDSKYSSYKQGVTHLKREITQNYVSSKSIVKRGNIVMVFEKREFNWGVIFYRDNEPISGSQYENGIRD
ncbi:MAG: tetratricopeptide repeat protein, partial [Bacteroidota bacterium]